ncbi:hypothetical protein TWF696_005131 [Orbilia brochopaga]|uniref:Uncharacterized protein n=1 Tax=Orbilia brochopaga TaxID=3140254 RepID=A0AAV9UZT0_9PEZI
MSLASLVSWQDMLSYSPPPPQGFDGPGTPPEVQEASEPTVNQDDRQSSLNGIQSSTQTHDETSYTPTVPSKDSLNERALVLKPRRKSWMTGKSHTFAVLRKPKPESKAPQRRTSISSKGFGDWASRAKRFFRLKKRSSKKGETAEALPVDHQDQEESSSASPGSISPDPRRHLLDKNTPSKITVRKASYRPDQGSVISSASSSSLSRATPVFYRASRARTFIFWSL